MEVAVGDVVTVRSSGEIVHDTALPNPVGPDGSESELRQFNVIVDVNHAVLIGRVGDEGVPFLVGVLSQFTADHSRGSLYLGINDVGVQNNTGSFTSVITIAPP